MAVRRHVVAAALVALVALTGCSEDEPTPRLPEETPTSAEPSPTEPETSEAAEETPEEFIRRWQAEVDTMQSTGEATAYRDLTDGCQACQDFADRVEQVYADGGSVESGRTRVVSVEDAGQVGEAQTFDVTIRSAPLLIRDASGEEVESFPGGRSVLRAELLPSPTGWGIRNFTTVVTK